MPHSGSTSGRPAEGEGHTGRSPQKGSFKRAFFKWTAITAGVLLVLFFLYRWAGTSHYKGNVQRVYEKDGEYRLEFTELDGEVRVVGNREIRFPYFKTATADLHAELNRLHNTGDVVEITVWGFRHSWFSMFPNVIDVDFLQSKKERDRLRAERLSDAIIAALANRGALKNDDAATREVVIEAILEAQDKPVESPQSGAIPHE